MKHLREITHAGVIKRRDATHEMLKKHYDNYSSADEQSVGQASYYRGGSRTINNYHWETHKGTPESDITNPYDNKSMTEGELKSVKHTSEHMDKMINHTLTPTKLKVYSGTLTDPRTLKDKEGIIHHPAYLSTSVDQHIAEDFARSRALGQAMDKKDGTPHMLKIHVPKGHPGLYMPSTSEHSTLAQEEKEFVLPRNTRLKYMKTTKNNISSSKDSNDNLLVHHMKVVPHTNNINENNCRCPDWHTAICVSRNCPRKSNK